MATRDFFEKQFSKIGGIFDWSDLGVGELGLVLIVENWTHIFFYVLCGGSGKRSKFIQKNQIFVWILLVEVAISHATAYVTYGPTVFGVVLGVMDQKFRLTKGMLIFVNMDELWRG